MNLNEGIERAAEVFKSTRKLVTFSGAGMSAESGIPTFRDPGGIWDQFDPEEVGTGPGLLNTLTRMPEKILAFVDETIRVFLQAKPNPGHLALGTLEQIGILRSVITQNVDNLHQKSGSRNVIEFHGNMLYAKCLRCARRYTHDEVLARIDDPSTCACGGLVKPDVIFFGEAIPPDALLKATYEARICDLMLVIGTSAQVEPAASLPHLAKGRNPLAFGLKGTGITKEACHVIEINREPTPMTGHISDFLIQGSAGEILSEISSRVDVKTKAP